MGITQANMPNQFRFGLPSTFVSKEANDRYMKVLNKNKMIHSSVLDYLNSTIISIDSPSYNISTASQKVKYGKEIQWKGAGNVVDYFSKEVDVVFSLAEGAINYVIMLDMILNYTTHATQEYTMPLIIECIDRHEDVIFEIRFKSLILKSLPSLNFATNSMEFANKTFSMTFTFNYIDILYPAAGVEMLSNTKTDEKWGNDFYS
jgi:hypothetical protein